MVIEPTDIENKVMEFYRSDLVSRQLPGRKDWVTVMSDSGEKEKVPGTEAYFNDDSQRNL